MPPNLKKSGSDLSRPSQPSGSFTAGKKPTEDTATARGLNISAEQHLGDVGGVKVTGKLTVGVDNLIAQQGLNIEADATSKTLGVGINVGSPKGKLGVSIGGKVGHDERGKISIRSAEAAINIGGFGGSASIDDEKGIGGSISVGGAKIEVTVDPKTGKKSLSLCYSIPGGELCTVFEPKPPKESSIGGGGIIGGGGDDEGGEFELACQWATIWRSHIKITRKNQDDIYAIADSVRIPVTYKKEMIATPFGIQEFWVSYIGVWTKKTKGMSVQINKSPIAYTENTDYHIIISSIIQWVRVGKWDYPPVGDEYAYIGDLYYVSGDPAPACKYEDPDSGDDPDRVLYPELEPDLPPSKTSPPFFPNPPQQFEPMNECCDKVEQIYRYLGIAKMKKKFKVANQFLAPGASGNTECEDYYALQEALFRMLANGLIINPTSSPNGTPWQSANASAWAGQMYEMLAESMSDGNSTQKVEIAMMMQLSQLAKILGELTRKVEFISECIGITPEPEVEEMPICFTIYEGHKGFGKKDKKLIDINAAKTDNQVEAVLAMMLQPSKIPIVRWTFKPDSISIIEALRQV